MLHTSPDLLTLPFPFLPITGHSFFCLLLAYHIPAPFCAVPSFDFLNGHPLCLPPMVTSVHFLVSCHSLLSATPPRLLKKRFYGEDNMVVGLNDALGDLILELNT